VAILTRPDREPPQWPYSRGHSEGVVAEELTRPDREPPQWPYSHCIKVFVILTIIYFTRVATVDMVLWEDTTIVPRDSQLWAIQ